MHRGHEGMNDVFKSEYECYTRKYEYGVRNETKCYDLSDHLGVQLKQIVSICSNVMRMKTGYPFVPSVSMGSIAATACSPALMACAPQ